jgi:hypothetical protein
MTIQQAIKQLLEIVRDLHAEYPIKNFTLDGRLVGDIGEVLVAQYYDLELFEGIVKHHDAQTSDGRKVQIKATMKNALTFPNDHIPDFYLGIVIHQDGTFTEIFNGPGDIAGESIKNRQPSKYNLHSVSVSKLKELNEKVHNEDRIPKRRK